jgi:hypothetical protein
VRGLGTSHCDHEQEVAVAAALSGDPALLDAYRGGDVYYTLARNSGLTDDPISSREGGVGLQKKWIFLAPTPFQPYRFEVPTRVFKFLNLIPGRDVCRLECALHPDFGVMDQSGRALVR